MSYNIKEMDIFTNRGAIDLWQRNFLKKPPLFCPKQY